jgi:hypothetical protein
MAWTVARLPLPDDWARARDLLAPLAERLAGGGSISQNDLLDGVLDAYRLRRRSILPLLAWMSH